MTTMYVFRKVLGKLEVKSFVSQKFGLLNMCKMDMGQQPMKERKGGYIYEDRTHT